MSINVTPTHPDADSYATVAEADEYLSIKSSYSTWNAFTTAEKEGFLKMATRQVDMLRFEYPPFYHIAQNYRDEQKRKHPMKDAKSWAASVSTGTTTSVTIPNATKLTWMPDNYWTNGAIVVREGTGRGQTSRITSFTASTGVVEFEAVTTALDSTSQIILIQELDDELVWATIEHAFFLSLRKDETLRGRVEGVESVKIGDVSEKYTTPKSQGYNGVMYSMEALAYLQKYISNTGAIIS